MSATEAVPLGGYRHEALLYSGEADFVERTAAFVRDGVQAGEPVFVVVGAEKIRLLRDALGVQADEVRFADMARVGRNPNTIIPAWNDFIAEHAGRPRLRGIGEPIYAARTADELVECQRHESLLNVAVPHDVPLWLVCPYDTTTLPPAVIQEAFRSHPFVYDTAGPLRSPEYDGHFGDWGPLPEPKGPVVERRIEPSALKELRSFLAGEAARHGLDEARAADFVFAVNEAATNSLRHGGGDGCLRLWSEGEVLICEIRDRGYIQAPLAGRQRPTLQQESGFGLWLVNHLTDLVQIRTDESGSVIRIHMRRSA